MIADKDILDVMTQEMERGTRHRSPLRLVIEEVLEDRIERITRSLSRVYADGVYQGPERYRASFERDRDWLADVTSRDTNVWCAAPRTNRAELHEEREARQRRAFTDAKRSRVVIRP